MSIVRFLIVGICGILTKEIVDSIAESSDAITKEEVFDTLKGFLKYYSLDLRSSSMSDSD